MKLSLGINSDGTQKTIDLSRLGQHKEVKQKEKNKIQSPMLEKFMPLEDMDSSDVEKQTDIAMAVRLMVSEEIAHALSKMAILNAPQAHAIARFENVRGLQMLPSNIPLTDDIKRLSMSIKGVRSEHLKDMVIGQKKNELVEKLAAQNAGA